jgi:hypothetical protein
MRRSVAQKIIKHFITLGVDSFVIADVMLYTIEIAQTFSAENLIKQDAFYKSIYNSFDQAVQFLIANGVLSEFKSRINSIYEEIIKQKWKNKSDFLLIIERINE